MESEHNEIATRFGGKCPKISKICSCGNIPWGSGDRNPISQQLSTLVGLPPAEKNGEDRSCTFWENWTRRTSTNSKQFWQSGLPELITDGAIWQKTKFPTFLLLELYVYLASFWSYDVKTTCPQQIECLQQLHDKLYDESVTNLQQFDNPQQV